VFPQAVGGAGVRRRDVREAAAMAQPRSPAGGGALIALGAVGGAAIGFVLREPTFWFLIGLGLGAAGAALVWLRTR
jgi:hypothetical protein